MLLKVGDIVKAIGAYLDDPGNLEFDQSYCLPFINAAWNDLAVKMAGLGLDYEEVVAELSNVPADTADLKAYQAAGELLETMLLPVKIEWKRVGDEDVRYALVDMVREIPDVMPGAEGVSGWEWRGAAIYITPSACAVDLRVRFKAYSVDFVDPVEGVIVGAGNIIAYSACEIINSPSVRGNAAAMNYFAAKGKDAREEFEALVIKQKNKQKLRIGSMSGRTRRMSRVVLRAQP